MEERNENNSDNDAIPEPKSKLQGLMRNAAPRISSIPSYPTFEEIPGTPDSGLLTHEDPEDILGASRSLDFTGESNDDSDIADYSDGDSSLSSSSSEESLTLTQRALRNRERHEQRIRELDEKYRDHVAPVVDAILQEGEDEENEDSLEEEQNRAPRGMLMKSTYLILNSLVEDETVGLPERIKVLLERYPHRESQIRALTSQLHATIGQVCSAKQRARYPDTVYVPSPIFITGPSGTGKTSIVCDVVEVLEKKENPNDSKETSRVGNAYINCATLEPSSIERLVVSAYSQLRPEEYNRLKRHRKQQRRRKRRKKSAQIGQISTDHSTKPSTGAAEPPATNHEPATLSHGQDNKSGTEKVETGTGDQLGLIADTQQKLQDDDGNDVSDRRVQPKRAVKTVLLDVSTNGLPGTPSKNQEMSAEGDSVEVSHSAVVAFGRSLQTFYGVGSKRCALLILDHSERLLSLSARKKKNEKTNFLAELLLLPKVMKLNLTIISISKQSTLNDSRKHYKSHCSCIFVKSYKVLSLLFFSLHHRIEQYCTGCKVSRHNI